MTTNLVHGLPDWASAIQKQVTKHEDLYEIITTQREQLAEQHRLISQQQQLLTALTATIASLHAKVDALQTQPAPATPAKATITTVTTPSPTQPQPQSAPMGTKDSMWAQARTHAPKIFEPLKANSKPNRAAPRRMPPARFFSSPPIERSSYTMTYLQVRHRSTPSQVREQLRAVKVNSARILDITMPASGVVGLLHHSEFTTELKSTLSTNGITVIDFDPRNPHWGQKVNGNPSQDGKKVTLF
jgi:hypothetical protein